MVDLEIVQKRMALIRERLNILKRHQSLTQGAYLQQRETQLIVEHALLIVIQSILDLGNHILADQGIRDATSYRDVILKLAEQKILAPSFAQSILPIAAFRNRLVHDYPDLDSKKVYELLQTRLGDFEQWLASVAKYCNLT